MHFKSYLFTVIKCNFVIVPIKVCPGAEQVFEMLRLLFFVVLVVSLQAIPAHWPKYTEPTPPPPPDQAGQYGGEYAKGYVEDSVIDLLANRGIEEPENAYLVKEGSAKDIPVTVDYSIDEKPVKILN